MEFHASEGFTAIENQSKYWKSFIEKEDFEFGIMKLLPGQKDDQQPHKSDEVYYIISGNGYLKIDNQKFKVEQGKIFYVKKGETHHFLEHTEPVIAFYALN